MMAIKPVAVILSGCGVGDGSEITESVGLLIALSESRIPYACFAPNRSSMVIDHLKGAVTDGSRNILVESARIARGDITDLDKLDAQAYDALILPGGAGVLNNLCNFSQKGINAELYPDIKQLLLDFIALKKPIVALCAAPLLLALALKTAGLKGAHITLGRNDPNQSMVHAVTAWGQIAVEKPIDEACIDSAYRFISAPAYMDENADSKGVFASCRAAVAGLQSFLSPQ